MVVHLSNTFENSKYYHSYIHSSLLLFLVFTVFTSNASALSANVTVPLYATITTFDINLNQHNPNPNHEANVFSLSYLNRGIMKFNLSSYPYISSAILHLLAHSNADGFTDYAYSIPYSTNTDTVTWATQPALGSLMFTTSPPNGDYTWLAPIDVTNYINSGFIFMLKGIETGPYENSHYSYTSYLEITYTASPIYNNTNTIIVSKTGDYNSPITTTTTPDIYLTTWVNNSLWSWYSPSYTNVYMIDPTGYTQPIESIWGQNAYQQPYTIRNPIKGNYIFEIYCSLCYPTILASTTLTYSTNATIPTDVWFNSVKIPNSLNALSVNYHIDSSQINYTSTHMQLTYQGNCKVNLPDTTNIPITGYDGYQNIDTIVYNTMLNRGFSEVCVRADLMNLNNTILDYDITDYFLYYIPDTPTPNPTPPPNVTYTPNPNVTSTYPTPMPAPTSNVTVIPTYPQPTVTLPNYPNGNTTGNFTGNNATNNASGWSTTINNMTGYIIGISSGIGNITNTTNNLSGQLNSVNQTKSRTILLPAFTYALPSIPTDVKLLFLYVVVLVGVLLIMDR
jgi:hypothetical protein